MSTFGACWTAEDLGNQIENQEVAWMKQINDEIIRRKYWPSQSTLANVSWYDGICCANQPRFNRAVCGRLAKGRGWKRKKTVSFKVNAVSDTCADPACLIAATISSNWETGVYRTTIVFIGLWLLGYIYIYTYIYITNSYISINIQ